MVEINSWTQNRDGVARVGEVTANAFSPLGFTGERVPSTNPSWADHWIMTRSGTGPHTIALVSHLDTVFPPEEEARNDFRWRPEGDRIFGPGTYDIKGGTVMMWLTLQILRELHPELFQAVTWKLLWNSSEEVLSPDFGGVCRGRLGQGTLAALVFEGEGKGPGTRRLVVARKGRATWRVRVRGRGAHAGVRPESGANAVVQLARLVDRIEGLNDEARQLSCNVGRIQGGVGLNRVPHVAEAEGEFRAFSSEAYTHAKNSLLALAGPGDLASKADGFRCTIEVEITDETRPWPRNSETDKLFEHWRSAGELLGQVVEPEARGGLSDGNGLWDYVPTLDGLGPNGDNDHCSERSPDGSKLPEFVDVSSFVPKAALNVAAIVRLVATAG